MYFASLISLPLPPVAPFLYNYHGCQHRKCLLTLEFKSPWDALNIFDHFSFLEAKYVATCHDIFLLMPYHFIGTSVYHQLLRVL